MRISFAAAHILRPGLYETRDIYEVFQGVSNRRRDHNIQKIDPLKRPDLYIKVVYRAGPDRVKLFSDFVNYLVDKGHLSESQRIVKRLLREVQIFWAEKPFECL